MSISEERYVTLNLHFLTQFKRAMSTFVLISGVYSRRVLESISGNNTGFGIHKRS